VVGLGVLIPIFKAALAISESGDILILTPLLFAVAPASDLGVNSNLVSSTIPKHQEPKDGEEFEYYLAGLIEGDGYVGASSIEISFSEPDVILAHRLQERLGFGTVRKVKDKKAYVLSITSKYKILIVLNMINGKIKTTYKFNQILKALNGPLLKNEINFTQDTSGDFGNHWLSGFVDADGSYQIKVIIRKGTLQVEIRLKLQIDQKRDEILKQIRDLFGGYLGHRASQDTYYYESTSFGSAKKIVQHFDKYHLQSMKYMSYLRWRKAYMLVQLKEHLTKKGQQKIKNIKAILNKHKVKDSDS